MAKFDALLTSPRDWPENWQELRTIDRLLRCSICSEFFNNTTVLPSCSHNYCSLCIRKYLAVNPKCPSCYVSVQENQLENNRIIDEIVTSFKLLRNRLLEIVKENAISPSASGTTKSKTKTQNTRKTPRRKSTEPVRKSPTRTPKTAQKRLRIPSRSPLSGNQNFDGSSAVARKRQRRQSTSDDDDEDGGDNGGDDSDGAGDDTKVKDKSDENNNDDAGKDRDVEGDECDCDDDDDDVSSHGETPDNIVEDEDYKPKDNDDDDSDDICIINKPSTSLSEGSLSSSFKKAAKQTDAKDLVDCPVCRLKIHSSKINAHLDACLTSKDRKENLRSSSQSPNEDVDMSPVGANALIPQIAKRKPLNKLVYTLLKDKQLKQKLKEHGLSIKGDRQTLVKRHQEFTVMYNSECSKKRPKSVPDIVRIVEEGERKKKRLGDNVREKSLNFDRGQSQEEIDKMKDEYLAQNQDQFSRLINDVRNRKKKSQKLSTENEKSDRISPKDAKSNNKNVTPSKRRGTPLNKLLHSSDEDTASNSSADFETTSKRLATPRRQLATRSPPASRASSSTVTRLIHSSAKKAKQVINDDSDDDDEDNVNLAALTSNNQSKLSTPTTSAANVPEPPSLLDDIIPDNDSDVSSGSETLLPPAFGPSSPETKEVPETPPQGEESPEF